MPAPIERLRCGLDIRIEATGDRSFSVTVTRRDTGAAVHQGVTFLSSDPAFVGSEASSAVTDLIGNTIERLFNEKRPAGVPVAGLWTNETHSPSSSSPGSSE